MQVFRARIKESRLQHYSSTRGSLVLATSFLGLLLLAGLVRGALPIYWEISSNGTIVYESARNLAPIPEGWNLRDLGHIDYSVLHNGHPSIRIDGPPTKENPWRECDTFGIIPVKPGDRIVFKIWIKTGHSTLGNDGKPGMGALIGIDFFGPSGRLWENCPNMPLNFNYEYDPTWSWQSGYQWVPYNTDWTLRVLDIVVPDKYFTTTDGGIPVPPQQVTGFVAWFYMHNEPDAGSGWFADAELYINP